MILAVDVETSNLPPRGMGIENPQYPWPMQIGAVLFDVDGRDHAIFSSRIRADGRTVSDGAQAVHGISAREAGRSGIPEIIALAAVCHFAGQASYMVGFNIEFDRDVLHASILRLNQDPKRLMRPGLEIVDLMKPSSAFCKLDSGREDGQYKFPRLGEALSVIRNERPRQGRHDALRDAMAAKRLFFSLRHRGAFEAEAA